MSFSWSHLSCLFLVVEKKVPVAAPTLCCTCVKLVEPESCCKIGRLKWSLDNVHVHLSLLCFSLTPTSPRVRSCECECIHEVSSFLSLSSPVILPTYKLMSSPSVLQVVQSSIHLLCRLVLHHSNQGRIKLKYWFFYQKFPVHKIVQKYVPNQNKNVLNLQLHVSKC